MTEQAPPQRAHLDHPHDRHGNRVQKGQIVEFVWAGEHHKGEVAEISTDDHGHHYAHVVITASVPCTATSVRKDENPAAAEKDGSKVEHQPPITHGPVGRAPSGPPPSHHRPGKDTK